MDVEAQAQPNAAQAIGNTTDELQIDAIQPSAEAALELLEGLVRIPSISGVEGAAVRWLVERMAELGFHAYVDEVGNAVGEIGVGRPETVLLGHIDTVPGDVPVRVADGRLYGRGTVDAKGPLATFVMAAARVAQQHVPGRIVIVGCVEEEAPSSKGAHGVVDRYAPDTCIVGEPSGWDRVTLGYKGSLRVRGDVAVPCGHSAHARQTAAERMAAWWQHLQSYAHTLNSGRRRMFDQLQPTLLQLNSGSDGLQEWASAEISVRLPATVEPAALASTLQEWDAHVEITVLGATPAFESERHVLPARALSRALRQQGIQPRLAVKTGTADMNIVGPAWGCPTVAYGPGDAALDHTPDEHIVLDDYLRAIDVLEAALKFLHNVDH